MTHDEPQFTLGIEEEYLLVDKETRSLVVDPPESLLSECKELLGIRFQMNFCARRLKLVQRYAKTSRKLAKTSRNYVNMS